MLGQQPAEGRGCRLAGEQFGFEHRLTQPTFVDAQRRDRSESQPSASAASARKILRQRHTAPPTMFADGVTPQRLATSVTKTRRIRRFRQSASQRTQRGGSSRQPRLRYVAQPPPAVSRKCEAKRRPMFCVAHIACPWRNSPMSEQRYQVDFAASCRGGLSLRRGGFMAPFAAFHPCVQGGTALFAADVFARHDKCGTWTRTHGNLSAMKRGQTSRRRELEIEPAPSICVKAGSTDFQSVRLGERPA